MVISDIVAPFILQRNSQCHIFLLKNRQRKTGKELKKFADISTFLAIIFRLTYKSGAVCHRRQA
jgi:hypothetical protein